MIIKPGVPWPSKDHVKQRSTNQISLVGFWGREFRVCDVSLVLKHFMSQGHMTVRKGKI